MTVIPASSSQQLAMNVVLGVSTSCQDKFTLGTNHPYLHKIPFNSLHRARLWLQPTQW